MEAAPMFLVRPNPKLEIEFIEDADVAKKRLLAIIESLVAFDARFPAVFAYRILLSAAIKYLESRRQLHYFPIPWNVSTGLPDHPSLVADAVHYCRSVALKNGASKMLVDSFAGWNIFSQEKIFCSHLGILSASDCFVDAEIVIHHPARYDFHANTLEVKHLVGVRSNYRKHLERHYKLRRESRVDSSINIVAAEIVKLALPNLKLVERSEELGEQINKEVFYGSFFEICRQALIELA